MDLSSVIGLLIGILAVFLAQMIEGGTPSVSLLHPTAAIIVFGGTIGATMLNFSFKTILNAFYSFKNVFVENNVNPTELIFQIVNLSELTRREGSLSLEQVTHAIENPLLKKGVQLIADSANPRVIKEILSTQINYEEEAHLLNAKVFEIAGGYAPTFGIIGAVLGLIQAMQHLNDFSQLGVGIATAFISTVYGVGIANLILLPLGGKIRIKAREEIIIKEMIVEGILSIHAGENPSVVQEKLSSFLINYQTQEISPKFAE